MSSENIKDGGPAFPIANPGCVESDYMGMSLRDYFAAKAMCGSLGGVPGDHLSPERLARESYEHADAMLKERAK